MQEDYKRAAKIKWTSKYVAQENPSVQSANTVENRAAENDSNTIRTAQIRGIEDPRHMKLGQTKDGEEHAIAHKRMYYCTHSELRKDHLRQCLLKAEHGKNMEKCRGIRQKTVREGNKKMWYVSPDLRRTRTLPLQHW